MYCCSAQRQHLFFVHLALKDEIIPLLVMSRWWRQVSSQSLHDVSD